jgi:glycosyltransferase involved in cell wall biosynthesis
MLATPKQLPISVCMISGPEAGRIGRALASVAPWASEIIVVLNEDAHDGTEEIARQHGAKVFREPWKGHIAQKNSAAQKATQDWVLGLDADEVVSPGLCEEILAALADPGQSGSFAAFSFPRLSWYCGRWIRHGDWYPNRQTRLWRRGWAKWGGVDPHDKLLVEGPVRKLRCNLLHYTTDTFNHQVAKTVTYADAFVQHRMQTGQHITFADLLVRPAWRFVRGYFLKLGFLDGWQGYAIAWLTAFYTFLRYAKAREAQAGTSVEELGPR